MANWQAYRYLKFSADQKRNDNDWSQELGLDGGRPGNAAKHSHRSMFAIEVDEQRRCVAGRGPAVLTEPVDCGGTAPAGSGATFPDETTASDALKGQNWGVLTDVTSISITNVPAGKTLNMGAGTLAFVPIVPSGVAVKGSFAACFEPYQPGFVDGASHTWTESPLIALSANGKGRLELPAREVIGNPPTTVNDETVAMMLGFVNATPGWSWTAPGSWPTDGWHGPTASAFYVFGSGATCIGRDLGRRV